MSIELFITRERARSMHGFSHPFPEAILESRGGKSGMQTAMLPTPNGRVIKRLIPLRAVPEGAGKGATLA